MLKRTATLVAFTCLTVAGCGHATEPVKRTEAQQRSVGVYDSKDSEPGPGRVPPVPAKTAQALFASLQDAERANDYVQLFHSVDPEQRSIFVWGLWFDAAYTALGAESTIQEAYRAIVRKYELDESYLTPAPEGIGPKEHMRRGVVGKSLPSLFSDLMGFARKFKGGKPFIVFSGAAEVEVTGDRAVARGDDREFAMRRVDGGWYFVPFANEEK